jgi:hypothetical protein
VADNDVHCAGCDGHDTDESPLQHRYQRNLARATNQPPVEHEGEPHAELATEALLRLGTALEELGWFVDQVERWGEADAETFEHIDKARRILGSSE